MNIKNNRKKAVFSCIMALVMIVCIISIPASYVKAETKFSEKDLEKIYYATWQSDFGEQVTISKTYYSYGKVNWTYVGLYEDNTLEFKADGNIYLVGYSSGNRVLMVTLYYDGVIGGTHDVDMYSTRIDGDKSVSAYDIFEGKGISLIGETAAASKVVKPDKVTVSKCSSKEGGKLYTAWKAVDKADGYQIVYATDSKFTKNKTILKAASTVHSKTISKLTVNKTYYIKVRAYTLDENGNKLYGSYSKVSKAIIKK